MADPLEVTRKRLLFRANHRGMQETDRLLGGFADANLGAMTAEQLGRFERLLEESDQDILTWVLEIEAIPANHDHDLLAALIKYKRNM
jgi:antitoxin CptB